MGIIIASTWNKKLGTDLTETSLPLYGHGPAVQAAFRDMWKFSPRPTAFALAKHDYTLRWYRRGDDIIVQF